MSIRWSIQIKKNRQRLYLYTHISYISYTYPIHIALVVPSRQCLFTYLKWKCIYDKHDKSDDIFIDVIFSIQIYYQRKFSFGDMIKMQELYILQIFSFFHFFQYKWKEPISSGVFFLFHGNCRFFPGVRKKLPTLRQNKEENTIIECSKIPWDRQSTPYVVPHDWRKLTGEDEGDALDCYTVLPGGNTPLTARNR